MQLQEKIKKYTIIDNLHFDELKLDFIVIQNYTKT